MMKKALKLLAVAIIVGSLMPVCAPRHSSAFVLDTFVDSRDLEIVEKAGLDSVSIHSIQDLLNRDIPETAKTSLSSAQEELAAALEKYDELKSIKTKMVAEEAISSVLSLSIFTSYSLKWRNITTKEKTLKEISKYLKGKNLMYFAILADIAVLLNYARDSMSAKALAREINQHISNFCSHLYDSVDYCETEVSREICFLKQAGVDDKSVRDYFGSALDGIYETYRAYTRIVGEPTVVGGGYITIENLRVPAYIVTGVAHLKEAKSRMKKIIDDLDAAMMYGGAEPPQDFVLKTVQIAKEAIENTSRVYSGLKGIRDRVVNLYENKFDAVEKDIENARALINEMKSYEIDKVTQEVISSLNNAVNLLEGAGATIINPLSVSDAPADILSRSQGKLDAASRMSSSAKEVYASGRGLWGTIVVNSLLKPSEQRVREARSDLLFAHQITRMLAESAVSLMNKKLPEVKNNFAQAKAENRLSGSLADIIADYISYAENLSGRIVANMNAGCVGAVCSDGRFALARLAVSASVLTGRIEGLGPLLAETDLLAEDTEKILNAAKYDGFNTVLAENKFNLGRKQHISAKEIIEKGILDKIDVAVERLDDAKSCYIQAFSLLSGLYSVKINELRSVRNDIAEKIAFIEIVVENAPREVASKFEEIKENFNKLNDFYGDFDLMKVAGRLQTTKMSYEFINSACDELIRENPWLVARVLRIEKTITFSEQPIPGKSCLATITITITNTTQRKTPRITLSYTYNGMPIGEIIVTGATDFSVDYDETLGKTTVLYTIDALEPAGTPGCTKIITIKFETVAIVLDVGDIQQMTRTDTMIAGDRVENITNEEILFFVPVTVYSAIDFDEVDVSIPIQSGSVNRALVWCEKIDENAQASATVKQVTREEHRTTFVVSIQNMQAGYNFQFAVIFGLSPNTVQKQVVETTYTQVWENNVVKYNYRVKVKVTNPWDLDVENVSINYVVFKGVEKRTITVEYGESVILPELLPANITVTESVREENGWNLCWEIGRLAAGRSVTYVVKYTVVNLPATAQYIYSSIVHDIVVMENTIRVLENIGFDVSYENARIRELKTTLEIGKGHMDAGEYNKALEVLVPLYELACQTRDSILSKYQLYLSIATEIESIYREYYGLLGYAETVKNFQPVAHAATYITNARDEINNYIRLAAEAADRGMLQDAERHLNNARESISLAKNSCDNIIRQYLISRRDAIKDNIKMIVDFVSQAQALHVLQHFAGLQSIIEKISDSYSSFNNNIISGRYVDALTGLFFIENDLRTAMDVLSAKLYSVATTIRNKVIKAASSLSAVGDNYSRTLEAARLAVSVTVSAPPEVVSALPYDISSLQDYDSKWLMDYKTVVMSTTPVQDSINASYENGDYMGVITVASQYLPVYHSKEIAMRSGLGGMETMIKTMRELSRSEIERVKKKHSNLDKIVERTADNTIVRAKLNEAAQLISQAETCHSNGAYANAYVLASAADQNLIWIDGNIGYRPAPAGPNILYIACVVTSILIIFLGLLLVLARKKKEVDLFSSDVPSH